MKRKEKASAAKAFDRAGAGLVSFSSVVSEPAASGSYATAAESPAYTGSNATIAMLFRKAAKRDPTTRVKAFRELAHFLQFPSESGPTDEQVAEARSMVSHFAYLYIPMCFDSDRHVRSALNNLLKHVVLVDKRCLGPHMQTLMGPWRMAMCDPFPESARHATEAFKSAIPPKKRRQVLLFLSTPTLSWIHGKMTAELGNLPDAYGAADPAPEVVEERYERVVSTAVLALARLIEDILVQQDGEGESKAQELKAGVKFEGNGLTIGLKDVIDEEVFRKTRDPRPVIRQAAYDLIVVLSTHASSCLEAIPMNRLGNHLAQLAREKHPPCMEKMMHALLGLVRAYPQLWDAVDICKLLLPPLVGQVRTQFQGSAPAGDTLLPLIASLPNQFVSVHNEQGRQFILPLLNEQWAVTMNERSHALYLESLELGAFALLRDATTAANESTAELAPLSMIEQAIRHLLTNAAELSQTEMNRLVSVLRQLHRAASRELVMSTTEWNDLLWTPLTVGVLEDLTLPPETSSVAAPGKSAIECFVSVLNAPFFGETAIDFTSSTGLATVLDGFLVAATVPVAADLSKTQSTLDAVSQLQWACGACALLLPWLKQEPVPEHFLKYANRVLELSHAWCQVASQLIEASAKQREWGVHGIHRFTECVKAFAACATSAPAVLQDWLTIALAPALEGRDVLTSAVILASCTPQAASTNTLMRLKGVVADWTSDETRSDIPKQKHIIALGYLLALVLPEFAQELLEAAQQAPSRLHVWILLSLSMHPEHECVPNIRERVMTDLLQTALLFRLRDEKDARQTEEAKFIEASVGCMLNWGSVEHVLLPTLDAGTKLEFAGKVCDTLSAQFSNRMCEADDGSETFNTTKWCSHVARLLRLHLVDDVELLVRCGVFNLANFRSITSTAKLAGLLDVLDQLETQLQPHQSLVTLMTTRPAVALWIIGVVVAAHHAVTAADAQASFQSTLTTDAVSLWCMLNLSAMTTPLSGSDMGFSVDAVERLQSALVATLASVNADEFVHSTTAAIADELAHNQLSEMQLLTVTRAWQFALCHLVHQTGDSGIANYRLYASSSSHIVVNTIPPGDAAEKQDTVWYIDSNAELQKATVLNVHREGVIEPYYTIQMQEDSTRELQTEPHRLLRAPPKSLKRGRQMEHQRFNSEALGELLSLLTNSGLDASKGALLRATLLEQAHQSDFDFTAYRSTLTDALRADDDASVCATLFELAALSHYPNFMDDGLWVLTKLSSWVDHVTEQRRASPSTIGKDVALLAMLASVCEQLRCSRVDGLALDYVDAARLAPTAHACLPILLNSIVCNVMGLRIEQVPGLLLCDGFHPALKLATISKYVWVQDRIVETIRSALSVRSVDSSQHVVQFGGEVGFVTSPFVFDILVCKSFMAMKHIDEACALSLLQRATHDPLAQLEEELVACVTSSDAPVSARLTAAGVAASLAKETTLARVTVLGTASEEEKEEDVTTDEAHDANAFEMVMGNALASVLQVAFTSAAQERTQDAIGELLCWALCMAKVDVLAVHNGPLRARVGTHLRHCGVFDSAMDLFLPLLPDVPKILPELSSMLDHAIDLVDGGHRGFDQLVAYSLFSTVRSLPAMSRTWWSDTPSRHLAAKLLKFVEQRVSPSLIEREVNLVELASNRWDSSEFTVRGHRSTREITAAYVKDEITIEMTVKLQASYPLKNVEVECSTRLGIAEKNWRRWVLQIVQLLSLQDGSVVDAVLLWKNNVDREMEGVEPCPICFSTLHFKSHSLPSLACRTCSNKFHRACLYKWFQTSGKSKCVLCQQPFFSTFSS